MTDEAARRCPKCQTELVTLAGGLVSCPKCGFPGDKPAVASSPAYQTLLFWILLVAPAALALSSFLLGQYFNSRDAGSMVGLGGLFIGLIGSFYCSWWVTIRFVKAGTGRIVLGLFLCPALLAVNFFIVAAGCSGNLSFH